MKLGEVFRPYLLRGPWLSTSVSFPPLLKRKFTIRYRFILVLLDWALMGSIFLKVIWNHIFVRAFSNIFFVGENDIGMPRTRLQELCFDIHDPFSIKMTFCLIIIVSHDSNVWHASWIFYTPKIAFHVVCLIMIL